MLKPKVYQEGYQNTISKVYNELITSINNDIEEHKAKTIRLGTDGYESSKIHKLETQGDYPKKNKIMKIKIFISLFLCCVLIFVGCKQRSNTQEVKEEYQVFYQIDIEENDSVNNILLSREIFILYIEPILIQIQNNDYKTAKYLIDSLQQLSIPYKDSLILNDIYNFYKQEIIDIEEKKSDIGLISLMSDVLYLYQDSIDKIDIDYLLNDSVESTSVYIEDIIDFINEDSLRLIDEDSLDWW